MMSTKEKFKLSPLVNEFVPRAYTQPVVENASLDHRNLSTSSTSMQVKINRTSLSRDAEVFNNSARKSETRKSDYKSSKFVKSTVTGLEKHRSKKQPSSSNNYERCDQTELREQPQRAFIWGSSTMSSFGRSQSRLRAREIYNDGKNGDNNYLKSREHGFDPSSSSNVGDCDGSKWIEVKSAKDKRTRAQNFESTATCSNSRADVLRRNQFVSPSNKTANKSIKNRDEPVLIREVVPDNKHVITVNKEIANNSVDVKSRWEEGTKKKKKTSAQRREEYQKKLQCLPSTQGKVVTVTSDVFHFINTGERVSKIMTHERNDENPELGRENFPVLGGKSSVIEDDSCWSDIETLENAQRSKNVAPNKYQKMEDYPELSTPHTKKSFNVSRKPNYSELFKKVAMNQSNYDSETMNESVDRRANCSTKINRDAKASPQVQNNVTSKPKSHSLIKLDIVNMIHVKQDNHKSKHNAHLKEKKMVKIKPVVANILDSSAPARRRGKEREIPRKRKPTTLKKIILKERQERKLAREVVASPKETAPAVETKETDANSVHVESSSLRLENHDSGQMKHSRKFREYCSQKLSPEIDEVATKLIQDLIRFHDRVYQKDPVKAKMRRRMVVGLKEITKHLKLKRIKCLILAPNLERISNQGGLDDVMSGILSLAEENNVPVVFALGRRKLGRVCLKKVPVSGVGIFNYDGSEINFKKLMELVTEEKQSYSNEFERTNFQHVKSES